MSGGAQQSTEKPTPKCCEDCLKQFGGRHLDVCHVICSFSTSDTRAVAFVLPGTSGNS